MPTYPKLHGTGEVVAKPGTLKNVENADGIVWTVTLNGKKEAFVAYGIARGVEVGMAYPEFGIPAGFYIDGISRTQVLYGANADESCYEYELTCRTPSNMGDGIIVGDDSANEVFTVDWEAQYLPLAQMQVRYDPDIMKSFVTGTKQTVWGFIQMWIKAESIEVQGSVVEQMRGTGSADQIKLFEDFLVMYSRGVETRETFFPVLVRTKRVNTVIPANQYPGQIVSSGDIPSGFDDMMPAGTWTYRRMATRIERIGRSGGYNIIDRWVGDPAWDTRLFGTAAQMAANYQTLG